VAYENMDTEKGIQMEKLDMLKLFQEWEDKGE
jgi:hypothetical protein